MSSHHRFHHPSLALRNTTAAIAEEVASARRSLFPEKKGGTVPAVAFFRKEEELKTGVTMIFAPIMHDSFRRN